MPHILLMYIVYCWLCRCSWIKLLNTLDITEQNIPANAPMTALVPSNKVTAAQQQLHLLNSRSSNSSSFACLPAAAAPGRQQPLQKSP